jgi:hypothetical protein
MRDLVAKNPGAAKLTEQYRCTVEEFMRLPYVEIYRRENQGRERLLEDAKIVDKQPDPKIPGDVMLTAKNPGGVTFLFRARPLDGGWALVQMQTRPQTE